MRIVGGKHRGRELQAGADRRIRPTADRTREALFNILAHGEPFQNPLGQMPAGMRVLDVFAGTGAVGLEALSRGARHVTFIDDHPDSVKLIRLNAGLLKEIPNVTILQRDAQSPGRAPSPCQLVFMDPPYKLGVVPSVLTALDRDGWLDDKAFVVAEMSAKDEFTLPTGFRQLDDRIYGAARLLFLRREPTAEKE
jgi:16S rRNA (guanine966-N2)-methyltransferase